MKLRICGLLAIAAFAVAGFLGSVGALAQNAYITNLGSDNLSVIATATNTVTATIPVGSRPLGVAVTPDGGTVYVTNQGSDSVSMISTATNTVTATIPVGREPYGVAVSPDGRKVCHDPHRNQPTRPVGPIDRGDAAIRGLAGRPCAARNWRSQTSFTAMGPTGARPMPDM